MEDPFKKSTPGSAVPLAMFSIFNYVYLQFLFLTRKVFGETKDEPLDVLMDEFVFFFIF